MLARKTLKNFETEMRNLFRTYKRKMRINKNWRLSIEVRREQNTFATVEYVYDYRMFKIYINDRKNGTLQELKDTLIHEFLHIILTPYTVKLDKLLDAVKKQTKLPVKQIETACSNSEEAIVRKLTRVLMDW